MFEDETKKDETSAKIWIAVAIVAVLLGGGTYYYLSHLSASAPAPAAQPGAVPAARPLQTTPDAVKDLKVQRAAMDKDRTGTTAIWLVTIENRSAVFAYSDIQYETSYFGADNRALLVNTGILRFRIGPLEQISKEIRDALYPAGTAWFKFKIIAATATKQ